MNSYTSARSLLLLTLLVFGLSACGKYLDRFSSLDGTTNVVIEPAKNPQSATLLGGLMVYFISQNASGQDADYGKAIGFTQEDLTAGRSIALPNGTYKIFGLGYLGPSPLGGAARCALGNNGGNFVFSGGDQQISLNFSAAACSFGAASFFSSAEGASGNSGNFDELRLQYCSALATGGDCAGDATNTTNAVRFTLTGGTHYSKNNFAIEESISLTSNCFAPAAGLITGTPALPIGTSSFSVPMRVDIYSNSSCTTTSAPYILNDGLESLLNPLSGASIFTLIPGSQSYSFLKIKLP